MGISKYILIFLLFISGGGYLQAQTKIKVFDFNVRMGGEQTNYDVRPFANLIRQYDPDFVTLQEVDYKAERSKQIDFVTLLAAELGMFPVFGKAIPLGTGEYGVAILSKYPFINIQNKNLTSPPGTKEARTVLYADVEIPSTGLKVRIASTHLDNSTEDVRKAMANQVTNYVGNSLPTLLAGDFNAKPEESSIISSMASWQRICNNDFTFPNTPTSKIDYIFGTGPGRWTIKSYQVIKQTGISDHCALFTEVEYQ